MMRTRMPLHARRWPLITMLVALSSAAAGPALADEALRQAAQRAVSTDEAEAEQAIDKLRAAGPHGLDLLIAAHRALLDRRAVAEHADASHGKRQRLKRAIDEVAAQKDAHAARLYWHTDWNKAVAAARDQNKPILSLRLLGRLDRDYSCANSRFFRTALYPAPAVRDKLASDYVLHWKSLRPVPRITIDMGDGRKIERTITGNSIHYIMDADGRVLDAVPGLYAPGTFAEILQLAERLHARGLPNDALARHHRTMAKRLASRWTRALARHAIAEANAALPANRDWPSAEEYSYAARANELAPSKAAVERPFFASLDGDRLATLTGDDIWAKLGQAFLDDASLPRPSVELMREKAGGELRADAANRLTMAKSGAESPMLRMVRRFQRSVARDTAMNEYRHHRQIYNWLADAEQPVSVEPFNQRVYAKLFKAPLDDPWMGLVPANGYSALDNRGLVQR